MKAAFRERAEELVRRTGARVTRPRVEVLAVLCAAKRALTHQEVGRQLRRTPGEVDRVTIYRVLDWLTAQALAHRVVGEDRVWRFNAAADDHAHFRCDRCGGVTCLERAVAVRGIPVPSGFVSQEIELTVKGLCAGCVSVRPAGRRGTRAVEPRY